MKTTKQQFEQFKKECWKWQNKFELNDWGLKFEHIALDNANAEVHSSLDNMKAYIYLDNSPEDKEEITIPDLAKHEMLHLLLVKITTLGKERFVTIDEMIRNEESLVRLLEKIIK